MSSPRLVPFEAHHLRGLVNRDTHHEDPYSLTLEKIKGGPAFTALDGDLVVGCAGLVLPWPGMGIGWMVLSDHIERYALWMTRIVRRFLHDARLIYGLHRLEAMVLADNVRNQRWIEMLGFTREQHGVARQYTSDRADGLRYEWIGD